MECECCRTSLSARLDGEDEGVPGEAVDAHLEQCAACRAWQAEAGAMTRGLRLHPAVTTPDLVDSTLAVAPPPRRRRRALRLALGIVAVAQLGLGLVQVLGLGAHAHPGGAHLFNESTAWNLALGAGLLWAALRDRSTSGLLPVLGVFLLVLAAFSVHDLSTGAVGADRVASHGLLALGLGLLYAIDRSRRGDDPHPTSTGAPDSGDLPRREAEPPQPATRKAKRNRRLRPTAKRAA